MPTSPAPERRDVDLLRAMLVRVDPRDPGAFNNLGVLYHTRCLYAEAVEAFLRALAVDPRMRTAAHNLEITATQPGACDARLSELAARVTRHPDDRGALLELARLARLMGNMADARRQLDALIAEDPDDAMALLERGVLEQRAGDLRRAQRWLERAANAGAGGDAVLLLGEVLYQRGQNEQALDILDALLRDLPESADAHRLRGFVLGDMGRHEEASLAAERAAALNPFFGTIDGDLLLPQEAGAIGRAATGGAQALLAVEPDGTLAHYGLGLAFRQRGYFREARREFERALRKGEDERFVAHALAELDLIGGDAAAARERYERLLNGEARARWWNEHGVACHQLGELPAAAESYRRALHLDPRYALAFNNLGVALADRGDDVASRESLLRASDLDPTLVLARLNLVRVRSQHGDVDGALSLLRELVTFRPREAEAWYALGALLAQRGRLTDAREAFVQAIEQRPSHAEARYALGQVLSALGDHGGATRETQQALGIASFRAEVRLAVGIDLQLECPDAVGGLDLLRVAGGSPLAGVSVEDGVLDALLPEAALAPTPVRTNAERAAATLETADAFAIRTLHGEAVERYREARELLTERAAQGALWRRAAVGEARSLCLLSRGRSARRLLEQLVAETPDDAEVCVLHADAVLGAKDGRELARAGLLRVLRQDARSAALLHYAGDVAVRIPDNGLAIACFRRALAIDPSRPTPRVSIARLLRVRGDLLAAHLELTAALATAPHSRSAIMELARVHGGSGRLVKARQVLVDHLARVPTDLEALALLADVLVREAREHDARVVVDRVLRHDPAHPAARWYDGLLHANRGRSRDAYARWQSLASESDAGEWAQQAREALPRLRVAPTYRGPVFRRASDHVAVCQV